MHVIILAAGVGSRLGFGLPKCLVVVNGKTLLHHQIELLHKIDPFCLITIVAGFNEVQVRLEAEYLKQVHKFLYVVSNPNYESKSILESLRVASLGIKSKDVLRISGDCYFKDTSSLKGLLSSPKTSLAIRELLPEEIFEGGRYPIINFDSNEKAVSHISLEKSLAQNISNWVWADFEIYKNDDFQTMMESAHFFIDKPFYHLDLLNYSIHDKQIDKPLYTIVNNVFEIDTPEDLEYVRHQAN